MTSEDKLLDGGIGKATPLTFQSQPTDDSDRTRVVNEDALVDVHGNGPLARWVNSISPFSTDDDLSRPNIIFGLSDENVLVDARVNKESLEAEFERFVPVIRRNEMKKQGWTGEITGSNSITIGTNNFSNYAEMQSRAILNNTVNSLQDLGLMQQTSEDPGIWASISGAFMSPWQNVEIADDLVIPNFNGQVRELKVGVGPEDGFITGWITNSLTRRNQAFYNYAAMNPEFARTFVKLADRSEWDGRKVDPNFDPKKAVADLMRDRPELIDSGVVTFEGLIASPDQETFDIQVQFGSNIEEFGRAANAHPIASMVGGLGGGLANMLADPRELAMLIAASLITEGIGGLVKLGAGAVKGGAAGVKAVQFTTRSMAVQKMQRYLWHAPTMNTSWTIMDRMTESWMHGGVQGSFLEDYGENMKQMAIADLFLFGLFKGVKGGAGVSLRTAGAALDGTRLHVVDRGALGAVKKLKSALTQLQKKEISLTQFVSLANDFTTNLSDGTKGAAIRAAVPRKSALAYIRQMRESVNPNAFHFRRSVKDPSKGVGITGEGKKARETQDPKVSKGADLDNQEKFPDAITVGEDGVARLVDEATTPFDQTTVELIQYSTLKVKELRLIAKSLGLKMAGTKKQLVDVLEATAPRKGKVMTQAELIDEQALKGILQSQKGKPDADHPLMTNSVEELDAILGAFGLRAKLSKARKEYIDDNIDAAFDQFSDEMVTVGANANPIYEAFGASVGILTKPFRSLDKALTESSLILRNMNLKIRVAADMLMDLPTASRYQMKNGASHGSLSLESRVWDSRAYAESTKQKMKESLRGYMDETAGDQDAYLKELWEVITERRKPQDASIHVREGYTHWKKYRDEWWDEGQRLGIFSNGTKKVSAVHWNIEAMNSAIEEGGGWRELASIKASEWIRKNKSDWDKGKIHNGYLEWIHATKGKPQTKRGKTSSSDVKSETLNVVEDQLELRKLYEDNDVLKEFTDAESLDAFNNITSPGARGVKHADSEKATKLWFMDLKDPAWDKYMEVDAFNIIENYQWSMVPRILEAQLLENVTGISGLNFNHLIDSLKRDKIRHAETIKDPAAKAKFIADSDRGFAAILRKRDTIVNRGPLGMDSAGHIWWFARNASRATGVAKLGSAGFAAFGELPAVILSDHFSVMRLPQLIGATLRTLFDKSTRKNLNALFAAEEWYSQSPRHMMEIAGSSHGIGPNKTMRKMDQFISSKSRAIVSRMYGLGYVTRLTKTTQTLVTGDGLIRNISKMEVYNNARKGTVTKVEGARSKTVITKDPMSHEAALRKAGIKARDFGLMDKYQVLAEMGTMKELVDNGYFIEVNGYKILDFDRIDKDFPVAGNAMRAYRSYINGVTETLTATRSAISTPTGAFGSNPASLMMLQMTNFTLAFTHRFMPYLAQSGAGKVMGFFTTAAALHLLIRGLRVAASSGDVEAVIKDMEDNPIKWMIDGLAQMPFLGMMNYAGFNTATMITTGDFKKTEIPMFGGAGAVADYLKDVGNSIVKGVTAGVHSDVDWTMNDWLRLKRIIPTLSFLPLTWAVSAAGFHRDARNPGDELPTQDHDNAFSEWIQTPDGKKHSFKDMTEILQND